jgi:hypothetical protein
VSRCVEVTTDKGRQGEARRRPRARALPRSAEAVRGSSRPQSTASSQRPDSDPPDDPPPHGTLAVLFPAVAIPTGTVSWRSPEYPHLVKHAANEGGGDVYHLWEWAIRHVATALEAWQKVAEPKTEPTTRILVQDRITGPWLRTLKNLIGEGHRMTPSPRID